MPLWVRRWLMAGAPVLIGLLFSQGPAHAQYVDSRLCARCHRQIADDYARTGMGRSFFRPSPANTLENYSQSFYHALSDTHFAMILRDGQYFQRRWQKGPGGQETNVEELKIDYVMGSGNHARSYLHRTPRGTLIELPLGWYSEGTGHWDMSPGSDSDHPRTRRFVSYKCMFCHNGYPQIPPGNEVPGSDPVYIGALPEGIDCQRCHGPGGRHLRTVETRGSTPADLRASIVNPARLGAKQRMETCMQCHLETSSGRIPASIVRFDRGPFSFVPGESLDAFMLSFDHAQGTGHDDKFEAVSSVYRLLQSRCFQQSPDRLTCDTCHNPHRVPRGQEAVESYAKVCLGCHSDVASASHTASRDCIGCHMPKRRAQDTPGMVMTDHRIQRRPPPGLLTEFREPSPEPYLGEVAPYYPRPLPPTPANKLYQAVAQVALENNLPAGLPVLAREIAAQKPREPQFYVVLGDAWQSAGKPHEAVAAYEQAVQLNPKSLPAILSLAGGLTAAGEPARAAETLQRAAQLSPADPIVWYRQGMLDFLAGRVSGALEKLRHAITLDPSLPDQSRSLGEILTKAGQPDQALAALHEALRTDPYDDRAWDLAGRVLAEKGEMTEAFYDFEKAIRLRPNHASHLHDYALALARADRFDEAQQRAEAAIQADPNLADAHELLGGLFARKRQLPEAAREYRRTLELRPDSGSAHLRLANVLAAQGDTTGAVQHLRAAAASPDRAAAEKASDTLRQMGVR